MAQVEQDKVDRNVLSRREKQVILGSLSEGHCGDHPAPGMSEIVMSAGAATCGDQSAWSEFIYSPRREFMQRRIFPTLLTGSALPEDESALQDEGRKA